MYSSLKPGANRRFENVYNAISPSARVKDGSLNNRVSSEKRRTDDLG